MRADPLPLRAFGALAFAAFVAFRPATAAAEGLPTLLVHRTEGAADCPDAGALALRVASQMKRVALEPLAQAPSTPSIDVQIDRTADGYTAVVRTGDKTRTLADGSSTCGGLAEALAISLAIYLDTELPPASAQPSPAVPPVMGPVYPVPAFPALVPWVPAVPPPRRIGFAVSLGAGASEGLVTPGTPAIGGDLELRVGQIFTVAAGVLVFPTRNIVYPSQVQRARALPSGSVDVSLATGFVRGCATVLRPLEDVRVAVCAEIFAGVIAGAGNYAVSLPQKLPWVAGGTSVLLERKVVGPVAVAARASLAVPFVRQAFFVDAVHREAFTPAPIGAVVGVEGRVSIW